MGLPSGLLVIILHEVKAIDRDSVGAVEHFTGAIDHLGSAGVEGEEPEVANVTLGDHDKEVLHLASGPRGAKDGCGLGWNPSGAGQMSLSSGTTLLEPGAGGCEAIHHLLEVLVPGHDGGEGELLVEGPRVKGSTRQEIWEG